jgi:hypothetical protein
MEIVTMTSNQTPNLIPVEFDHSGRPTRYQVIESEPRPMPQMPAEFVQGSALVNIEHAVEAQEGADERTTATDRAWALLLRLAPLSVILLVISVSVALVFDFGWLWAFYAWGIICAAVYWLFDNNEYRYSRNGLERHRIDTASELRKEEMAHEYRLKRMALKSYLRMMERYYGDSEQD